MKSLLQKSPISLAPHTGKLFTTALVLFGFGILPLFLPMAANSQSCEKLFETTAPAMSDASAKRAPRTTRELVDESWKLVLEQDYVTWLRDFEASGIPIPESGIGRALFMHWKMAPAVTGPLLKIGFRIVEPTAEKPNEVARFEFPESFQAMTTMIARAQDENQKQYPGSRFRLATYNDSKWLPLNETLPLGVTFGSGKDTGIEGYARMLASGYVPLWPSRRSLLFVHDLGHVTEFLEYPAVFPALQKYFSRYMEKNWIKDPVYTGRAEIFNEASYILKPEKYAAIDALLVSEADTAATLDSRASKIFDRLGSDREGTLNQVYRLTSKFNDLVERHGGGARDPFNLEATLLSVDTVANFVDKMIRDPADGNYSGGAVSKEGRIEFLESLEGINRQIQILSEQLLRTSGVEDSMSEPAHQWYLSYRVAQLEVAFLTQRNLRLSHVDIIQDSMLPMGSKSKTRTYFQSFQPKGSRHFEVFVGQ